MKNDPRYEAPQLLIGGRFVDAPRRTRPIIDPASSAVLAELPLADTRDLDDALAHAQRSFPHWKQTTPTQRGRILHAAAQLLRTRADAVARCLTLEQGKPLAEARIEMAMAADTLAWFAEEGRRAYGRVIPGRYNGLKYTVTQEPVGPVASLAPWNFPATNAARKIGAALAAGCSCIHKPAEEAPSSALAVARALMDAGLPEGVLSVVFGDPAAVSRHLIESPVIRKVSFTGSVAVGRQLGIAAAAHGKRTTMELGGHAPVVVDEDVDIDGMIAQAVDRKYTNAGQVCVSPTRFYVHERHFERFVTGFAERAGSLHVGHGLDADVRMGPLAHARRPPAVLALIDDAAARGARIAVGGRRRAGPGHFVEPTLLADVPEDARIMNEEPFGPVAIVNRYDDLDQAVRLANRLPFGLAAFGFTRSLAVAQRLSESLEAGMIGINTFRISLPDTPFVGIKDSGHGAENGIEGLQACLVTRLVAVA